jgi:hypothetical protein
VRDELVTGLESDRDWRELLTLEVKIIIATNATNLLVISAVKVSGCHDDNLTRVPRT